jgi:hypothetical protein
MFSVILVILKIRKILHELSNSDDEVVENGKTLSSPDFGEINTFY